MAQAWKPLLLTTVGLWTIGCQKQDERTNYNQSYRDWQMTRQQQEDEAKPAPDPEVLPVTHFAAGQLFEEQGNLEQAVAQYQQAVKANPKFISAYNRLGVCYDRLGQFAEADRYFQAALKQRPDLAYLYNNYAFSLMLQRRWEQAESVLRQALNIKPDYDRARINLAVVLAQCGQTEEAYLRFNEVVGEAGAFYNLGLIYKAQKKYSEAVHAFQQAVEIDPKMSLARVQLVELRAFTGNTQPMSSPRLAAGNMPDEQVWSGELMNTDHEAAETELPIDLSVKMPAIDSGGTTPPADLRNLPGTMVLSATRQAQMRSAAWEAVDQYSEMELGWDQMSGAWESTLETWRDHPIWRQSQINSHMMHLALRNLQTRLLSTLSSYHNNFWAARKAPSLPTVMVMETTAEPMPADIPVELLTDYMLHRENRLSDLDQIYMDLLWQSRQPR
ncbi:MAG: Photosystem I assembly protein Ycf3 [Phycisphaerae bacterium]|nr:Photosystem I assembly protein Ycf3 [Phycisphaerae bacterium]